MYGSVEIRPTETLFLRLMTILGEDFCNSTCLNIKIYENEIISGSVVFLRLAFTHKSGN